MKRLRDIGVITTETNSINNAVKRAGTQFTTSSKRAANIPKRRKRRVRYPIIESSVLIIL